MPPTENKTVRLDLTEEQKAKVKEATGKKAEAVELTVEELEERIAPTGVGADGGGGRLAGNRNEPLLVDD